MPKAKKQKQKKAPPALPSRQDILEFVQGSDAKVGKREIARAFGITGAERIGLKRMLRQMADEGLIASPHKAIRPAGTLPPVTVLRIFDVDEDGDLIALPTDWDEAAGDPPRVRLALSPSGKRHGKPAAGPGDRVLARIAPPSGNGPYEGRVMKLLERVPERAIGVFRADPGGRGGGRIVPVNRRQREFIVAPADAGDAEDGELVAIEPRARNRLGLPSARIAERVGDVTSEKAISLIALEEHNIPYVFPPRVLAEAEEASPAGMADRDDWRDMQLITIDPADARDHDDAVHARPDPEREGGFIVTVAIADVAWYVRPGSAMDKEAEKRGNSVYFPGRVVPMLPERISNDLCSLRAGEDRPALAVRMHFDGAGRKLSHRFHRVMMRSAAALSYEETQAAIDGHPNERTAPLLEDVLKPLWAAYKVLHAGREDREPLELDVPERKVVLTETGAIDRIYVPPRLDAHKLIEEFMIQANVAAAEELEGKDSPLVYRIHDEPSFDKLEALRDFLGSLDLNLPKKGSLRPAEFNRILRTVADTAHSMLVNEVVLRSQSQAQYSTQNIGHFGLNLRRYAHFTSPIRRYADLLVHRALISALSFGEGGLGKMDAPAMEKVAADISLAERRAMAAERDTLDRLIAAWLSDQVGAHFWGRIRGVTRAGLFVELEETGADGFVPIGTLGAEYFAYDEALHRLTGTETGLSYQLGERVEVRLLEATPFAGDLKLEMLSQGTKEKGGAGGRRRLRGPTQRRRPPKGGRRRRK
ncbi:ribonuclease R [Afifella pfennigii]|uniref:ribonuclease R n=1 Tax=Afifella pfennigii TaxID=209897 RepID=UPI00068EF5D0|nr:ribonuclease R [Afifella pfennigii]